MRVEVKPYTYAAIPLIPYVEDELGEMAMECLLGVLEWKSYPTTFEPGSALLLDKEQVHVAALEIQPCEELGDVTVNEIADWVAAADARNRGRHLGHRVVSFSLVSGVNDNSAGSTRRNERFHRRRARMENKA